MQQNEGDDRSLLMDSVTRRSKEAPAVPSFSFFFVFWVVDLYFLLGNVFGSFVFINVSIYQNGFQPFSSN